MAGRAAAINAIIRRAEARVATPRNWSTTSVVGVERRGCSRSSDLARRIVIDTLGLILREAIVALSVSQINSTALQQCQQTPRIGERKSAAVASYEIARVDVPQCPARHRYASAQRARRARRGQRLSSRVRGDGPTIGRRS